MIVLFFTILYFLGVLYATQFLKKYNTQNEFALHLSGKWFSWFVPFFVWLDNKNEKNLEMGF